MLSQVKLTIQSEVFGGTILQQVFIVEFTVNGQFCEDCHKAEAKDFWKVLVSPCYVQFELFMYRALTTTTTNISTHHQAT